ncbi:NYN domain-containing protein [Patescibacteria group bacterium]|nr:NYN domain-containing protein [Patescibacteria group bacterium]MBU1721616.1 NYN domain-containing protein [Patescibacteria group bacterium]MBU1901722.1 NYN domain-containing protein [Patescibacteria group bacterium]
MMEKRYVFIDSQNLHWGIKTLGWTLDYKRFFVYLQDKYKVEKVFLFVGFIEENKNLYRFLKQVGYIIIFKPTIKDHNGKVKGNVDAELVLQALHELSEYDEAIIISGDGDFHCLLKYLIERNKLCCVLIPNKRYCSRLIYKVVPNSKFFQHLEYFQAKLEYKKTPT